MRMLYAFNFYRATRMYRDVNKAGSLKAKAKAKSLKAKARSLKAKTE